MGGISKFAKKDLDWGIVEREYREGVLTVREIAAKAGCSHTRVLQQAKDRGWERNLGPKIQAKRDAMLSKEVAKELSNTLFLESEPELIHAVATTQTAIIVSQRKDIQRHRAITSKLSAELEFCGEDLLKKAQINKMLIESLKSLVALERQAFGISDAPLTEADEPKVSGNETARRIAFVLAQQINIQANK